MPTTLNPYLSFRDNAREAMNFYQAVFGGELTLSTFGEFQASDDPAESEKIMHGMLTTTQGMVLMGADIVLCDPHRAIISGPARLRGERLESPDIRAGMAMLIAALCAEGHSEIGNVGQIDRGYERIDERLRELGGRIERVATEPAPV